MTPTLFGRIQTRLFIVLVIGSLWTLFVVPFLPGTGGLGYLDVLARAEVVLLWVAGVGIIWELLYHLLQQFRWEKDWPILFAFLVGIPEGLLAWFLVNPAQLGLTPGGGVATSTFLVHFTTTWVVTWLWVVGPHRMVFIRWRFEGGRLV